MINLILLDLLLMDKLRMPEIKIYQYFLTHISLFKYNIFINIFDSDR